MIVNEAIYSLTSARSSPATSTGVSSATSAGVSLIELFPPWEFTPLEGFSCFLETPVFDVLTCALGAGGIIKGLSRYSGSDSCLMSAT